MQLRKNLEKVEYLEDQKILAPRLFSSQGPFCYIWTNFPVVSSLSLTKNSRALSPQCQRVKDTSSLDGKRSAISLFSRFWRDWLEETRHVLCQMSPWTFLVTLWELSRISISDRTESATLEIKRFLPTLGCPVLSSRRVHFSVCVQSSKLPTFVVELSRCTSRWDYSSELAVTFLRLDAIRASFTDYKYLQTHYFNRGCVSWIQMLRIPMFTQRRNANLRCCIFGHFEVMLLALWYSFLASHFVKFETSFFIQRVVLTLHSAMLFLEFSLHFCIILWCVRALAPSIISSSSGSNERISFTTLKRPEKNQLFPVAGCSRPFFKRNSKKKG